MNGTSANAQPDAAAVVAGVLARAIADRAATVIVLLEHDTPEGALLRAWIETQLGAGHCIIVSASDSLASAVARDARGLAPSGEPAASFERAECTRALGRVVARRLRGIVAHPINKTALLLGDDFPPEPLLPLGDLYASQVQELADGCTLPPRVRDLAERAGGLRRLDSTLYALLDRRVDAALACVGLPPAVRTDILRMLDGGRAARRHLGLIPKLGRATPGIDLWW
ncbi:MAG: hypothetical protein ACRELD_06320 [Longimicrobiales bacterium]